MSQDETSTGSFEVDLSKFFQFLTSIEAIVPECRLHVSKEGIRAIAVDCANVGLVSTILTDLRSFECSRDGEIQIGIDVCAVRGLFRPRIPDDPNFVFDGAIADIKWHPGRDHLILNIEVPSLGLHMQYDTLMPNTIRKDPNPPTLDLKSCFSGAGDRFALCVAICSVCSDRCRIEVDEVGRCYMAGSAEEGRSRCKLLIAESGTAPAMAMYSLDYLKDIARRVKGHPIDFGFSDDYPFRLTCDLAEGLRVEFVLAPRISESEEGAWI